MSNTSRDEPQDVPIIAEGSFLDTLLTPGSSLNPNFLLIVDGAFALLLAVLLGMLWLSSGNLHVLALIGIELALWASVKWFVHELQAVRSTQSQNVKSENAGAIRDKSE